MSLSVIALQLLVIRIWRSSASNFASTTWLEWHRRTPSARLTATYSRTSFVEPAAAAPSRTDPEMLCLGTSNHSLFFNFFFKIMYIWKTFNWPSNFWHFFYFFCLRRFALVAVSRKAITEHLLHIHLKNRARRSTGFHDLKCCLTLSYW